MRCQRVRMILEFDVPVGREHYGDRNAEASWQRFAQHDMTQWIRDAEEVPDISVFTSHMRSKIAFEWLEESEDEDPRWGRVPWWL